MVSSFSMVCADVLQLVSLSNAAWIVVHPSIQLPPHCNKAHCINDSGVVDSITFTRPPRSPAPNTPINRRYHQSPSYRCMNSPNPSAANKVKQIQLPCPKNLVLMSIIKTKRASRLLHRNWITLSIDIQVAQSTLPSSYEEESDEWGHFTFSGLLYEQIIEKHIFWWCYHWPRGGTGLCLCSDRINDRGMVDSIRYDW